MIRRCKHCFDTKYVLAYWLETPLKERGIHMTDIPTEIFKQIPVSFIRPCHCNQEVFLWISKEEGTCLACCGTTWKVTEQAAQQFEGIDTLDPHGSKFLDCELFVRCPCGPNEQSRKCLKKDFIKLKKILDQFHISIPLPRVGFV